MDMNKEQAEIAKRIEKLFDVAHKAGLQGGVYDSNFCIWPENKDNLIDKSDGMFFEDVEAHGKILFTTMGLDGGAGV